MSDRLERLDRIRHGWDILWLTVNSVEKNGQSKKQDFCFKNTVMVFLSEDFKLRQKHRRNTESRTQSRW